MKESVATSKAARLALAAIIAHAAIAALHGAAHRILEVQTSSAQNFFIVIVIVLAPICAGLLLLSNKRAAGALLLACSLAGSLVFGIYNHFIAISPDHVSHVESATHQGWVSVFRVTAVLLALSEAFGVWAGINVLKKS